MTQYAEIIFETGAHSIMAFDSEDELKGFLSEHHDRAKTGRPGAAQDQVERADIDYSDPGMVHPNIAVNRPAERIHKVLIYPEHPVDLHSDTVNADKVKELIDGMAVGGEFNHEQLIQALRDEASPVYPVNQGRLHSDFKAQEDGELDLSFLDGDESG